MKALFFPGGATRGAGHLASCLGLAGEMAARGWQAEMIMPEQVEFSAPHWLKLHRSQRLVYPSFNQSDPPAYVFLTDNSLQPYRDGFIWPCRVLASVKEACTIVRESRPDVLIGDLSLLTWMVGSVCKIPVVQIIQSIVHPKAAKVVWWREIPNGAKSANILPVYNPILKFMGLPNLEKAEDLLQGDLYLVRGIPALDPLPHGIENTLYTGLLAGLPERGNGNLPEVIDRSTCPVIYVTLGAGAGSNNSIHILSTIYSALAGGPWEVIVSTGKWLSPDEMPKAENFHYYSWLPGRELIEHSDLVIFHGGHTTMMEAVACGVPGLVIPYQSEQEGNGRRLQQAGAGEVISLFDEPSNRRLVKGRWLGGRFATWVVPQASYPIGEIRLLVEKIMNATSFHRAAKNLQAQASQYLGAKGGVEAIQRLLAGESPPII